jgi:hypothetical protein
MESDEEEEIEQPPIQLYSADLILSWKEISNRIKNLIEKEELNEESDSDEEEIEQKLSLNTAIPNGFQMLRSFANSNTGINSILYIPIGDTERFVTLDATYAHLWKNGNHYMKISAARLKSKNTILTPFSGVEKWIFVNQWKLVILSTSAMELRVFCYLFR